MTNPNVIYSNGYTVPLSAIATIKQRTGIQFLRKASAEGTEWIIGADTSKLATQYDLTQIQDTTWVNRDGRIINTNLSGKVAIKNLDTLDNNATYAVVKDINTGNLALQLIGDCPVVDTTYLSSRIDSAIMWPDTVSHIATQYDLTQITGDYSPWDTTATAIVQKNVAKKVHIGSTATPDSLFQVTGGAKFTRDVEVNGVRVGRGGGNQAENTAVGYQALKSNTGTGFNTAVGHQALTSNTTGSANVAVGYKSMSTNTDGLQNTALGEESMRENISGQDNTAVGYQALKNNTSYYNVAVGSNAMINHTSGQGCTAVGFSALKTNTSGWYNSFLGYLSGYANSTGRNNTGVGAESLKSNTTSRNNSGFGYKSLYSNTTGYSNTAVGVSALYSNTTASNLVAVGDSALYKNTGTLNTAVGSKAGYNTTTGVNNTFTGYQAGYTNTTGNYNVFVGQQAGVSNNTGSNNTFVGNRAGRYSSSGSSNTFYGYVAGNSNGTASDNTFIGTQAGYSTQNAGNNTYVGSNSGWYNTSGTNNTFLGYKSGYINQVGSNNTFLGYYAAEENALGSNNVCVGYRSGERELSGDPVYKLDNSVFIGYETKALADSQSNQIVIGHQTIGKGSNTTTIGNTSTTDTYLAGTLTVDSIPDDSAPDSVVTVKNGKLYRTLLPTSTTYTATSPVDVTGTVISIKSDTLTSWRTKQNLWTQSGSNINRATGSVGINTTNPLAKLHVTGSAMVSDTTYVSTITGGSAANSKITLQTTTGSGTASAVALQIKSGANDRVTVLHDGKVGIGTTNPTTQLMQKSTTATESAPLSAELLTSSGWTSTDWTGDFASGWTHTVGNTTTLLNSLAAINATKYQITWTITDRTAGTITITFGGWSSGAVASTENTGPTTSSTASLVVTPTSDFDGKVIISIKIITGVYAATYAIADNTNANAFEIRSSLASLYNQFVGVGVGGYNTTGNNNTANGMSSLNFNTTGSYNTATGRQSLYSNTTGSYNTATGLQSLYSNTTGSYNTATGRQSLYSNTTGSNNTANGMSSLYSNTTGSYNTANGYQAGRYIADGSTPNATGNYCVFIGADTKALADGQTNQIVIGYNAIGNGSNSVTLGNTDVTKTVLSGNVGIGTTAPSEKLEVAGTAKVTALALTTTDTTSVGYPVGTIQMRITAADTSAWLLIRSTGTINARWKKLTN